MVIVPAALLLLALAVRPVGLGSRPRGAMPGGSVRVRWIAVAALGGLVHGEASTRAALADCRWTRPPGDVDVSGWVREVEGPGRLRVRITSGPCRGDLRVVGGVAPDAREGDAVRVRGGWVPRADAARGGDPVRAGVLVASSFERAGAGGWSAARRLAVARGRGVERVESLFRREGDLVAALLFARRDGLDADVREAFTATGTAHLLAISGFHVGVLAGVLIWAAGRLLPPRRAFAVGAAGAWLYVGVLGFPDSASRAALLLSLATAGRLLGRPVSAAGALGSALLLLVVLDPAVAGRIGAQLSFAGAFGLVFAARPWREALERAWRARRGTDPGAGARGALNAVAVTGAATLATTPFVAWHFERLSTVGMPASLGATPAVALALPAVLAALALDVLHIPGAAVAAAGAEGLLGATRLWVQGWAAVPGASLPVPRPAVAASLAGAGIAWIAVRGRRGIGRPARAVVLGAGIVFGGIVWPVPGRWIRNGSLEIHMFDVGQGDALGVRTPGGRWVVIDAGPPGGDRWIRALRRAGVDRVALLVLTHPDADHVGGAAALLAALPVAAVAGPGTVRGDGPWHDAVEGARAREIPWRVVGKDDAFALDGVRFRVLHPVPGAGEDDPNAASVVLDVRWAGRRVLFTGDAPVEAESAFLAELGPIDVLKVGHHGSRTSTGAALLERILPEVALVSVGRGNRYGHPAPEVLTRLRDAGARTLRTDELGAVVVRLSRDGSLRVSSDR